MMPGNKGSVGIALVFLLGLAGVAGAVETSTSGGANNSVGLSSTQEVKLSPQQMSTNAKEQVQAISLAVKNTKGQLARARQARDVVKVLCLNDKVNQMDTASRSAAERSAAVMSALDRNALDDARHESTILTVLGDRVRTLVAEASQCIGQETAFSGESDVSVDIDPTLPDTDPSFSPFDPTAPTDSQNDNSQGPDSLSEPPVVGTAVK